MTGGKRAQRDRFFFFFPLFRVGSRLHSPHSLSQTHSPQANLCYFLSLSSSLSLSLSYLSLFLLLASLLFFCSPSFSLLLLSEYHHSIALVGHTPSTQARPTRQTSLAMTHTSGDNCAGQRLSPATSSCTTYHSVQSTRSYFWPQHFISVSIPFSFAEPKDAFLFAVWSFFQISPARV